jgi:hypothetical protein
MFAQGQSRQNFKRRIFTLNDILTGICVTGCISFFKRINERLSQSSKFKPE